MISAFAAFLVRVRLWVDAAFARLGFGENGFLILLAVLIGIVTAVAAVSFHELIDVIRDALYGRVSQANLYGRYLWLIVVFPAAGGLVVGVVNWLVNRGS